MCLLNCCGQSSSILRKYGCFKFLLNTPPEEPFLRYGGYYPLWSRFAFTFRGSFCVQQPMALQGKQQTQQNCFSIENCPVTRPKFLTHFYQVLLCSQNYVRLSNLIVLMGFSISYFCNNRIQYALQRNQTLNQGDNDYDWFRCSLVYPYLKNLHSNYTAKILIFCQNENS